MADEDVSLPADDSRAFPEVRLSDREVFRLLGNTHYAHIDALVQALDRCAGAGFTQAQMLSTRARNALQPAVSEVLVGDHFLARRYGIEGLDAGKSSDTVADLKVLKGKETAAFVEAYGPGAWLGLKDYTRDIPGCNQEPGRAVRLQGHRRRRTTAEVR
jgi:hypothetical protein